MTTTYGTLSPAPAFPARIELVRRGASSPAETGFVVSRQFRTAWSRQSSKPETRAWELSWEHLTTAERDSLLASFRAGRGAALPIGFTPPPPDSGTIPVRFVSGSLAIEHDACAQQFRARALVEEVI